MKIQFYKHRNAQGSVLLVCMLVAFIVGTVLASYLLLTQNQNTSVARSQSWNASIAITEAGIEEALSHLNRGAPYFDLSNSTNNLASNGWTDVGGGKYATPQRYLGNDYYVATISIAGPTPVINSTGYVHFANSYAFAPQAMFATAGVNQDPRPGALLGRNVKVETKVDPLFNVAMAALRKIDFNGKNVGTDSFDSFLPAYSDNGLYPTAYPERTLANGDVVTDYTIVNSLSVGNATIKGQVKTGPNGTITIGPNGSVGDSAWVNGGNTGIQPGHSANDMNVVFPDATLPTPATWLPPIHSNTDIDGVTYDYVLDSGDWTFSSMGGGIYKVYVRGNARLYVTGNINLSGNDVVRIAPTGASLKLYMAGATAALGGNGVINESGNAANFYYFGLPSNTSVGFNGNASYTGVVYAPQADFSLGGGGSTTYDFVGASVSKTVKMNGHFNFHYDENLRRVGAARGWIPTNWKEK